MLSILHAEKIIPTTVSDGIAIILNILLIGRILTNSQTRIKNSISSIIFLVYVWQTLLFLIDRENIMQSVHLLSLNNLMIIDRVFNFLIVIMIAMANYNDEDNLSFYNYLLKRFIYIPLLLIPEFSNVSSLSVIINFHLTFLYIFITMYTYKEILFIISAYYYFRLTLLRYG